MPKDSDAIWIHQERAQPIPDNGWAEVTHCGEGDGRWQRAFKAFVDGADIFSVTGAIGGAGHIFSLAYFGPPLAILV